MKLFLNKILRLGAVASLLFFSVFISPSAYSYNVINGKACVAANLAQATELKWNQARVVNPSSNPNTRFVTCTMSSGAQWLYNPTTNAYTNTTSVETGGIEAYFEADASALAEASCIVREMSSIDPGNAGADTAFIDIANPSPGLNDTDKGFFGAAADIDISFITPIFGEGAANTYTLTCALDPGVGINAYWLGHTAPDL